MEVARPEQGHGGGKTLDDHVFVARLWLERGIGEHTAPLWRGRVKYLRGEEVHVDGIEAALQGGEGGLAAASERANQVTLSDSALRAIGTTNSRIGARLCPPP